MTTTRRTVLGGIGAGAATLAAPALSRAQPSPLKIGVMYALSGAQGEIGNNLLLGTKVAAEQCNRAGGINGRKIELVVRDDKYSGSGAVTAARELAGDGINLMIGGSQTVMALGLIPLLPELKSVVVSPAAAGMALTHENYTRQLLPHDGQCLHAISRHGPRAGRTIPSGAQLGDRHARG